MPFRLLRSVAAGALFAAAPAAAQTIELNTVVVEGGGAGVAGGPVTQVPGADANSAGTAGDTDFVQPIQSSATKTATSRLATPQAVSVVAQDQIEIQNVRTIDEAVRYSSGVQGSKFGANNRLDWYNIRGFPAEQDGLFLDGLALFSTAFASPRIDPATLDRVEIIKGPASVLYGSTSPGGLVNLVSKRPVTVPLFSIEAGINDDGQAYSTQDFGGRLNDSGSVSMRWNSVILGGDTYADIGEEFRGVIAPSVRFQPDGDTSFTLYGYFQRDDSNNLPGFLPFEGTVTDAAFGRIDRDLFTSDPSVDAFDREQYYGGYEFSHRFDERFTLRQNLRYGHVDTKFSYVYPFGYANDLSFLNGLAGGTDRDLARLRFLTTPESNAFNVDTQLESRFATGRIEHLALMGLDQRTYRINDFQAVSSQYSPLNVINPVYGINIGPIGAPYIDNSQTLNQTGLYIQDQATLDHLVVTANARYDYVRTDLENNIADDASGDDGYFSGRVGATYLFDIGIAPYISYSTFFAPVLGVDVDTQRPFEQGEGDQIEGGVKYQPRGFESFVTASVFDLNRRNVLVNDVAGNRPFTQVQAGEIRSRGFELEGTAVLGYGFSAIAAYTSFDLEFTRSAEGNVGRSPTAIPDEFASLWLDYAVPAGRTLEGLRIGAGVRWTGESFANLDNSLEVPDFTVFDAAISYERANWKVQFNAANIGNKKYVASCSTTVSCFYGDPQRLTASVGYKW